MTTEAGHSQGPIGDNASGFQPDLRQVPTAAQLRALADNAQYAEAAALLDGVDLAVELDTEAQYLAGVCLGSHDRPDLAVDLLKRAAEGGFAAFWCAYHLGLFEIKRGREAHAAYYLSVSLILEPGRTDIHPLLSRVAPGIDPASLDEAVTGTRSEADGSAALELGMASLVAGNPGAAACRFVAALALDPGNEEARARLCELAPDISLVVLPTVRNGPVASDASKTGAPPKEEASGAAPVLRKTPTARHLQELANSGRHAEAAVLLADIDLDGDLGPDFHYYAGVCLGSVGQAERAIGLLKRAAAGGFAVFWCAYHLGLFEAQRGRPANAVYYYVACLILEPGRGDIYPLLAEAAPDVDLGLLRSVLAPLAEPAPDLSPLPKHPVLLRLQELAGAGRFDEAASLLADVDLDAEHGAPFHYHAAVCLGSTGQEERAVDLLRRAAAGGFSPLSCAQELGVVELARERHASAAYHLAVALILDPARTRLYPLLEMAAPDIGWSSLRAAQATRLFSQAPDKALAVLPGIGEMPHIRQETAARPGSRPSAAAKSVTARRLEEFANRAQYREAAALLGSVDLSADLSPDLLYFAGVCLGAADQPQRAVDLLKRAVEGGHPRFWCAYHLGLFEEKIGNVENAAFYYTAAVVLNPARDDIRALLARLAPLSDDTLLREAQTGTRSVERARAALQRGIVEFESGRPAVAACLIATALAFDPTRSEARSALSTLAPDAFVEVLTGIDFDRLAEMLIAELDDPLAGDLDRKLAVAAKMQAFYLQSWHQSAHTLAPALEQLFRRALAAPGIALDQLCMLYDMIDFCYFYMASDRRDMRGFGDHVVKPLAAAIRDGSVGRGLPPVRQRPPGGETVRLAYLSQHASLGPGNGVGPFAHHLLQGLARHFPQSYELSLYVWYWYDERSVAPLEKAGIRVRRFDAGSMPECIAAIADAIAEDEIDVLITDANAFLPTVLFERRVAPVQVYYMMGGQPFWPLKHIDSVFRLDIDDPAIDGLPAEKCVPIGLGPWDLARLAPEVDPVRVAAERASFPPAARLIGNYGRLSKITPEFLSVIEELLARHADLAVVLGGYGNGQAIRDFIRERGLAGRLELVDKIVDGHVWGHMIEVFLDTFPTEGGIARREVMAKGRPVVSMLSAWTQYDAVPPLVARDPHAYVEIVSRLLTDREFYDKACAATREFVNRGMSEPDYAATAHDAITALMRWARDRHAQLFPASEIAIEPRQLVPRGGIPEIHRPPSAYALAPERLAGGSVLDELRSSSPSRIARVDFGSSPIEVACVEDVLYLPMLLAQVWRGSIIPREANPDRDLDPVAIIRKLTQPGEVAIADCDHEINKDVCILSNFYSPGFYHVFEELFKVVILERYGFNGSYVLSTKDRPRFATEFLEILGIGRHRIRFCSEPTRFNSVFFTTPVTPEHALVYPELFLALREALLGAVAAEPGLGSRLWLERSEARVVVNAQQVRDCLDRHGFTVVDMADLPVRRQIAAARQAEVLAGPHGAGMIHSTFMKPHSTVIECFSPEWLNPSIREICRALQHRYFQIVAPNTPFQKYPHGRNVEVDCNHLELVLQGL